LVKFLQGDILKATVDLQDEIVRRTNLSGSFYSIQVVYQSR
jgi:hypothetical protein